MQIEKTYNLPFLKDEAHVYTLENGHTVVTVKKPGEISNVTTWVKTGSVNENDENTGISHFLEHLMFKGTERMAPGEFDKMMESRGGIINAATWKDYTFYYITIPNGENDENFKLAVDLHADMLLNSTLPQEEIGQSFDIKNPQIKEKRERSVVIEEIGMREDQPWNKTYNTLNSLMYESHPYKRDTIGTREVIAGISRKTIYDYYKTWYIPQNMITIIVSDRPYEEMLDIVRKHFVFKEERESLLSEFESEKPPTEMKIVDIKSEVNTGFGILGFHGPKPADLKNTIAVDILTIILGEGKSSRMTQKLIKQPADPIFNMAGASQYQFRDGNNILLQFNFKGDKKDEALEQIKGIIHELKESPITVTEFEKARKKLQARFAENTETASYIAESIGYTYVLTNDIGAYIEYPQVLKNITIEDLDSTLEQYFNIENACIATMTPSK